MLSSWLGEYIEGDANFVQGLQGPLHDLNWCETCVLSFSWHVKGSAVRHRVWSSRLAGVIQQDSKPSVSLSAASAGRTVESAGRPGH